MLDQLRSLVAIRGVSGRETPVADYLRREITPLADEVRTDAMGNLIALRRGRPGRQKLLVAAHMDEVGMIVTDVEDSGLLRCAPVGGVNPLGMAYRAVTSERGVPGILVPPESASPGELKADTLRLDIGAGSRREAAEKASVGDCFAAEGGFFRLAGGRIAGRPLDDRIGCAILLEAARRLAESAPENDVYFVFTVQEEVGCRGAGRAAFGVEPDIGLAVDVTAAGDAPGVKPSSVTLGSGAAIKLWDAGTICDRRLADELAALAERRKIAHQPEVLATGGTDTSALQAARAGCRAGCLSVPCRYCHTAVEMIDPADAEACCQLLCAAAGEL